MALVSANQFQLTPNFGRAAQTGLALGQQFRQGRDSRAEIQQGQQVNQLAQRSQAGDSQALGQLAGVDIDRATKIQSFLSNQSEEQRAETVRENESLTRTALIAKTLPAQQVRPFIERQRQKAIDDGRSTAKMDRALAGDDQQLLQEINLQAIHGQDIDKVAKNLFPPQKRTSLQENLIAAGLKPGTKEFQEALLQGATRPLVSIGGAKKEAEELAKIRVKQLGKLQEQRDGAIDANQSLDVLENIDVNTGLLEPAKQGIAAFGKAFGLDTSALANVSAGEGFNAEAKKLILSVKSEQKGPQTDQDEKTIADTVSKLGNTKEGNQFIINSARALNNRRIEKAEFFEKILEDTGTLKGANGEWSKFKRGMPMVSPKLRTREGLPVFFFKFEESMKRAHPNATREEVLETWQEAHETKKR